MKQSNSKTPLPRDYNRRLKVDVPGIATQTDKFTLENGYYLNETETIILKSTNETGKFFTKITQPS